MATRNQFQITDYADEKSSFAVTSITANAGNLAAQQTAAAALFAAIEDLTIGAVTKQVMGLEIYNTPEIPTDVYAHREQKWLVYYVGDSSGKQFTVEIAAPDLTDNLNGNSDQADLGSDDWLAFVSAFESFARSPENGTETVTVTKVRLVGRNI